MSSFSGFSDADILKLQNGEVLTTAKKSAQRHIVPPSKFPPAMVMKTNKQVNKQDVRMKVMLENKLNTTSNGPDLPDEAKLVNISLSPSQEDLKITNEATITDKKIETTNNSTVQHEEAQIYTSTPNSTEKKLIDLDEFTLKQKYMEEQNRIRKQQVAKALEDRTKRTQQEQQKLVEIQDEFKKLDATLSTDVKILRKEIESASYEYMDAQKRYNKIEKDFLDAKLFLHQKLEKKEMLTEHLCAIIEKNEERKADKLNELLQKLEVLDGADVENDKVQDAVITSNT